ncbi:helix-turn-helix domain-containing protein [Candidatus Kaiserbacteria bacterium]|nr:helix-turn-helix domain-containing protein [Candidatus Kaiserbacteria bacterium]
MSKEKLNCYQPTVEELFPDPKDRAVYEEACALVELAHRVGKQLRTIREESGFSQTQMAQKLGVTEARIMNIESGSTRVPVILKEIVAYEHHCGMKVSFEFVPPINTAA